MELDPRFFLSAEIHARKVKLHDGSEHEFHFKELSRSDVRKMHADGKDGSDMAERMVAACWVNPDGTPALDITQVMNLKPVVFNAVSEQVMTINGIGQESDTGNA